MTFDVYEKQKKPEANTELMEFNNAIAQVFAHPLGEFVLQYMRSKTIERPVSPPGCVEGYGYFREGQNDWVRQMEDAIRRGKEGK